MASRDPRVDDYIAKAQPFARPVLKHLRKVVHAGCPGVDETMKWSFPHEAKADDTRERHLKTAIEWMAEGKIRNWKYAAR